jgi:hypothetical protein
MTRRCETDVLAHCHEEYILVDEEKIDTHCDALLCIDEPSWHRHNIRRFSNRFLSSTITLHLDNRRSPDFPHDLSVFNCELTSFDCVRPQGDVKVNF